MAVYPTVEVCVDLNGDRDFSDANEDISAYCRGLEIETGANQPYVEVARANTATILLSNTGQRFSPQHASGLSGFEPGALVRVRLTDPTTTTQHVVFTGWIEPDGIQPVGGTKGERVTEVKASGFFMRLMDQRVRIAVQQDQRADQIFTALLESTVSYPPGLSGYWLLGHAGLGELGQTTTLATGVSNYASLETGVDTFPYAGDNWKENTTLYRAISDVVQAERGYVFENRAGQFVFYNRHHWHTDLPNAVDATRTDTEVLVGGLDYAYGNIMNHAVVKCHPRKLGTQPEVLGEAEPTIEVKVGENKQVTIRFADSSGNKVGGIDLLAPLYTANANAAGTGADLTGAVDVVMVDHGTSVDLTLINRGNRIAYVRDLRIKGTKLTDFGEIEVDYADESSINSYGYAPRDYALRLLSDLEYAEQLARWEVQIHKDPTGEARSITLVANKSSALMTYALANSVGARISLSETQTGLSGQYYIVGEQLKISQGAILHVTHFLQPAPPATAWILGQTGYGELGQTTYLGL